MSAACNVDILPVRSRCACKKTLSGMDGSDVHCIHSGIKSIMKQITPDVVVSSNHPLPVSLYVRFRLSFPCSNYAPLPTCVSGTEDYQSFYSSKTSIHLVKSSPSKYSRSQSSQQQQQVERSPPTHASDESTQDW